MSKTNVPSFFFTLNFPTLWKFNNPIGDATIALKRHRTDAQIDRSLTFSQFFHPLHFPVFLQSHLARLHSPGHLHSQAPPFRAVCHTRVMLSIVASHRINYGVRFFRVYPNVRFHCRFSLQPFFCGDLFRGKTLPQLLRIKVSLKEMQSSFPKKKLISMTRMTNWLTDDVNEKGHTHEPWLVTLGACWLWTWGEGARHGHKDACRADVILPCANDVAWWEIKDMRRDDAVEIDGAFCAEKFSLFFYYSNHVGVRTLVWK